MRRILFPLVVIGLAAGLFTLGSGAFFSDTATDTGNTITAGTLDVNVTAAFASNCDATALVKPGDGPTTCSNEVTNVGSITGDLWLKVVYNNTLDLGAVLTVSGGAAGGTGTETAAAGTWAALGTWKALALACTKVSTLDQNETFTISLPTSFSTGAGNAYQGGTASLDFHYALLQAGQTPGNLTDCLP